MSSIAENHLVRFGVTVLSFVDRQMINFVYLFLLVMYSIPLMHLTSFHNASSQPLSHQPRKVPDHNDLNNYRHASNQCFIFYYWKKRAPFYVSSHLKSQIPYKHFQSAYRPGHSTETALLKAANDLFLFPNKGTISVSFT